MKKQNKLVEISYHFEGLPGLDCIAVMDEKNDKVPSAGFKTDALQTIIKEDECMHTPDLRDFINWELRDDKIIFIYNCNCGITIEEMFTHFDTNVVE